MESLRSIEIVHVFLQYVYVHAIKPKISRIRIMYNLDLPSFCRVMITGGGRRSKSFKKKVVERHKIKYFVSGSFTDVKFGDIRQYEDPSAREGFQQHVLRVLNVVRSAKADIVAAGKKVCFLFGTIHARTLVTRKFLHA